MIEYFRLETTSGDHLVWPTSHRRADFTVKWGC